MAVVFFLSTTSFVMTYAKNFEFVGPIPEEMLDCVPIRNTIIQGYIQSVAFDERPIPAELQAIFDAPPKPKKGGKRKTQPSTKPSPHKSPSPTPPYPKTTPSPSSPQPSPKTTPQTSPKSPPHMSPTH